MKHQITPLLMIAALAQSLDLYAANFGDDLTFLRKHTEVVVLHDKSSEVQVIVVPAWQGRVMTSTARALGRQLRLGEPRTHRIRQSAAPHQCFWRRRPVLARARGRAVFDLLCQRSRSSTSNIGSRLRHWTPSRSRWSSQSAESVLCRREIQLTNYSGTQFQLEVNREVRLLSAKDAVAGVGGKLSAGVSAVAFETVNTVKNTGAAAWTKETGLLSIWILGMFNASTESTVVVPFRKRHRSKTRPDRERHLFRQSSRRPPSGERRCAVLPRRRSISQQDRHPAPPRKEICSAAMMRPTTRSRS